MKRIILSRKGFDSSAGGVASPIFNNGTIFSIPIPQKTPSPTKYKDLIFNGVTGIELLKESSVKSVSSDSYCHFDPLLTEKIGIFGQASSSQTELKKQKVASGDLFLFFGWFKQFSKKGRNLHHLFGWLQIDEVIEGSDNIKNYLNAVGIVHPHGFGDTLKYSNNTIYVGKRNLTVLGRELSSQGHGLFKNTHKDLILTEEKSSRSKWQLPKKYFSNTNNIFLNRLKWKDETNCLVDCLGYGQEFILNAEDNPKLVDWAVDLIENHGTNSEKIFEPTMTKINKKTLVNKPTIWSYVVAYDEGSAPCVDNNLLTLCICKPLIRRGANVGDWIIGFAKKKIGQNLITYVAEITEKISMEEYFLDSSKRLDKIYNVVDNRMVHYGGDIHNSPRNWKTDINGKYCLISQNFWYFGKDHRSNPEELYELYYPYVGQKKIVNPEELNKLKNYMNGIENGVHSHPKDMTIYLNPIVKKIKKDIQLSQSNLGDEYFYNSLSLCIIDAVFSMGVRYTSTENTVKKYCNFFKLQTFRDRDDKRFPNHKNQDTVENLISQIEDLSISKFTEQVFNNKQRTSTKSGILKTEAVLMFAKVLVDSGISSFKDIDKLFKSEIVEKRIKEIPGQNSGISFKYFLMLSGNDKLIKPDRMIIRYVEEIVGFKLDEKVTIKLIQDAAKILNKEFPNINSRSLDHEIWKYQKNL